LKEDENMAYSTKNIFSVLLIMIITSAAFYLFIRILPALILIGFIAWGGFALYKKLSLWLSRTKSSDTDFSSVNAETYGNAVDEFDLSEKTVIDVDFEKAD
jgi:hypothetical protein